MCSFVSRSASAIGRTRAGWAEAGEHWMRLARAVNDHADKLNSRLFSTMDYAVVARR